jgi:AbrB family looped-hinge helix DNA binding protein
LNPKPFSEVSKDEIQGVKRFMDSNVGRVTLPKEYRDELGIATGDEVEIFLLTDGIFIRPVKLKP